MRADRTLGAVTCCLPRDLPVARLAIEGMKKYLPLSGISVITRADAFPECQRVLGSDVELIDERELAGGMDMAELRQRTDLQGFPARAGWYFQQLVKLGYALRGEPEEFYLIWDCDTIPLRPIDFFDSNGRALYTMADEQNIPYFDTYERLFGYRPEYAGSFISQHMVVHNRVARVMFDDLCRRFPDERSWSWAIMNNLASANSASLFSEYETYGNYVKENYPDTIALRRLPWLREGARSTNTTRPSAAQLTRLAENYFFAAFESWQLSRAARLRERATALLGRLL